MASKARVVGELSEWLSTIVIAQAVVDAMVDAVPPMMLTLDNAKSVYGDFLEYELGDAMIRSILGAWQRFERKGK